jgi:radical SAM protein with 4Fe4S-binding SPASM domain
VKIYRQDPEIWEEYRQFLGCAFPRLGRPAPALYQCVSWKSSCVIDPFGALKICPFTDRFSSDLSRTAFSEGFYNVFPLLESERFTTASRCRDCSLRPICRTCPAKAYLETGDREKPVDYFCKLAQFTLEQDKAFQYGKKIV